MSVLEQLRPTQRARVMDLVRASGLSVRKWSSYKGKPAANPSFCYEWAWLYRDLK